MSRPMQIGSRCRRSLRTRREAGIWLLFPAALHKNLRSAAWLCSLRPRSAPRVQDMSGIAEGQAKQAATVPNSFAAGSEAGQACQEPQSV